MKKFFVTLLAVFYLGVSSGATVHLHFCMGKLVEMGLVTPKSEKCSKCNMEKNAAKDCCKHEISQAKVDVAQKISDNQVLLKTFSTLIKFDYFSTLNISNTFLDEEYPIINSSYNVPNQPVFLRNCSFLI